MVIFTVLVRQRWFSGSIFKMQSFCSKWVKSAKTPAQFVAPWWLIILFFGSCQTDHWLPRYGCFKFWVVGMCRYMYVYACMCMYVYVCVCICIYCMLGHGNHHSFPETPSGDPAPGGTHSGHPRACTQPLFDPIPIPHLDPILGFLFKNRCLDVYCHSCRIGHEHRDRPKHCPLAHPRALYRTHTRVPKSGMYLWLVGA